MFVLKKVGRKVENVNIPHILLIVIMRSDDAVHKWVMSPYRQRF